MSGGKYKLFNLLASFESLIFLTLGVQDTHGRCKIFSIIKTSSENFLGSPTEK